MGGYAYMEDASWMAGKTPASIRFVLVVNMISLTRKGVTPEELTVLLDAAEKIKSGGLTLDTDITPVEYLKVQAGKTGV